MNKWRMALLAVVVLGHVLLMVVLCGCVRGVGRPAPAAAGQSAAPAVAASGARLGEIATAQRASLEKLDAGLGQVADAARAAQVTEAVAPGLRAARAAGSEMGVSTRLLYAEASGLTDSAKRIEQADAAHVKEVAGLRSELEAAQQREATLFRRMWYGLMILGTLLMLAGGVIAYVASPRLGTTLAIAGLLLTGVSYAMLRYIAYIAIGACAVLVGSLVYAGVSAWRHRKALAQTVASVEVLKRAPWSEAKATVSKLQDKGTRMLVERERINGSK